MPVMSPKPFVPCFTAIEDGTVEQAGSIVNDRWNNAGTASLKALAKAVLESRSTWNTARNKAGTIEQKSVPLNTGACNGLLDYDSRQERFGERAAIYEYDGGLPREEAEKAALKDVLN